VLDVLGAGWVGTRPFQGENQRPTDMAFLGADTDNHYSQNFKSCFLLHYQKYHAFYALSFLQIFKNQDV